MNSNMLHLTTFHCPTMEDFVSTETCSPKPNYVECKKLKLHTLGTWDYLPCALMELLYLS